MNRNPSYENVKIGDQYVSSLSAFKGDGWYFISTVVEMEDPSPRYSSKNATEDFPSRIQKEISSRHNPMDRIVYVDIVTSSGSTVDKAKRMWVSQLLNGKV